MNSTVDDQMAGGQNLDEPHFDEEATILAAQPVVPLDEVKSGKRSQSGVAVALAIGGGLLIGLVAGTLIYRYLGANSVPRAETTTVAEQPAIPVGEPPNHLPSSAGAAVAGGDSAVTSAAEMTAAENHPQTSSRAPEVAESEPVRTPEVEPRRQVVRASRSPVDEGTDEETEPAIRRV